MKIVEYMVIILVVFTFFIPIIPLSIIYLCHSKNRVNSFETLPNKFYRTITREVEKYIKTQNFTNYLENDNIIIKTDDLDNFTNEHLYIKVYNKMTKQCFDITGDEQQISSIWAIFQTYFNDLISYKGLLMWLKQHDYNVKIQFH